LPYSILSLNFYSVITAISFDNDGNFPFALTQSSKEIVAALNAIEANSSRCNRAGFYAPITSCRASLR